MNEHDYEPIPGLPAPLPANEEILWQGAPDWRTLARRAMRVRLVSAWFALLIVWGIVAGLGDGMPFADVAVSAARLLGLAVVAVALLVLFAWLAARTTFYTITSRRVVMRFGIALPITIQIPFAKIQSAGLCAWPDRSGDIALSLLPGERIGYLVLCPHAKPWTFGRAQPSLRSIPDAAAVARILGRALAASASQPARAVTGPLPAGTGDRTPVPAAA
jgi:Bacterial PH domain